MKENTTHLYLVSTPCKAQTRVSIGCDDGTTHEGSQECCAPVHAQPLRRDEREAYLAALSARIQSGTYQIDCYAIAERVLNKTGQFYLEC